MDYILVVPAEFVANGSQPEASSDEAERSKLGVLHLPTFADGGLGLGLGHTTVIQGRAARPAEREQEQW
jgi:hypothetical protein